MSTASGYSGPAAGVPGARARGRAPGVRAPAASWLRRLLTRLGGADSTLLDRAAVDATEMTGRGFAALIPAIFGGLAATVAFEYADSLPVAARPPRAAAGPCWCCCSICR